MRPIPTPSSSKRPNRRHLIAASAALLAALGIAVAGCGGNARPRQLDVRPVGVRLASPGAGPAHVADEPPPGRRGRARLPTSLAPDPH